MHRIGILTGGGDVPGLNTVIKSVVYRASDLGWEVIGLRRGWRGLTHLASADDPDNAVALGRDQTRSIDRTGGTILHTSRTNPAAMPEASLPAYLNASARERFSLGDGRYDLTPLVLDNLSRLGITHLVPIGGDDTLSYAARLAAEGVPLLAIPKTMDNDVQGTEYCIGFSSAVTRARELIDRQRTTLGSHERLGVFRIFGRSSGYTAWYAAYVTTGRCLIPESPFELDRVAAVLAELRTANPSGYGFVIVAEGASPAGVNLPETGPADAYGHRRPTDIGAFLAAELRARTGIETVNSDLTYDLRSGDPDALDQMVAITFANVAVDLLESGRHGRMVAVHGGRYADTTLPDPALGPRRLDVTAMYDPDRFRPRYDAREGMPLLLGPAVN